MAKREIDPLAWLNRDMKKVQPAQVPDIERTFVKHERNLAESVKGKQTAGSGNKLDKGDVKTDKYRYEAKSTEKASLSIKLAWLEKIVSEALKTGRLPVVSIHFSEAELPCSKDWVLVEHDLWTQLSKEGL